MITVNNDYSTLSLARIELGGGGFILTGNTLLLDAAAEIELTAADHTIAAPLTLNGNLNFNLASGLTLEQSGVLSGDGGLMLNGGNLVLSASANSYTGATLFTRGTLRFSDPAQLGSSNEDPSNLVLGDGTLHYTGSGDTMSRGLTIDAAPTTFDKASAIRVDGDLEISGAFNALSGATIKTGPGTLHLTYLGEHVVNQGLQSVERNTNITYDADGSAGSAGFASFTLEQGDMIISGADQLATFNGDAFIGAHTLYSPEFIVSNTTVHSLGGWWSVGRGTGTTADPQSPAIKLLDGTYMNIQGSGLVLGNAEGNNDYLCYPKLLVDNSHLKIDKLAFISENSNAHPTIMVTNNAHFENSSENFNQGLDLSKNGGDTLMTVTDNSILSAYYLAVNQNANLIVEKGSEARLHQTYSAMPNRINGNLYFDDATLRPYIDALAPNWLMGMPAVNVRSGGLTIDVDKYAFLEPKLIEDATDSGGAVLKTGNGILAMRLPECDFEVQAGALALPYDDPLITTKDVGTISTAIGTTLAVSGQRALAGVTLPSGTALNLRSHSLSQFKKAWKLTTVAGNSIVRGDGLL